MIDTVEAPTKAAAGLSWTRTQVISLASVIVGAWLGWVALGAAVSFMNPEKLQYFGQFGDMFGALNTLFTGLAFFGLVLSLHQQAKDRAADESRRIAGHFETIALDVTMARQLAEDLLRDDVGVPAYRLPLHGSQGPFRELVSAGMLKGGEAVTLSRFYIDAESFNRTLDSAERMINADGNSSLIQREVQRARKKADHLIPDGKPSRFLEAIAVLKQHMSAEALQRLQFDESPVGPEAQFSRAFYGTDR